MTAPEQTSERRILRTFAVLRDLPSGDVLGFPAAEPSQGSLGAEPQVIAEIELFLRESFARARPEAISRHALPEGTELRVTAVVLPRDELPRRSPMETEIDIPYLVIPNVLGTWVSVLPFAHTFHVEADADIALAVREEASRLVTAQNLDAYEYLTKLPALGHRLVALAIPLPAVADANKKSGDLRKAVALHERRKHAVEVLETVAEPLHGRDEGRKPRPIEGRDDEARMLATLLGTRNGRSVLLVGRELVGKSAVLRAFIRAEEAAGRPVRVYGTSGAQLIAGMSGLGQWQERVRRVMEAAELLDAVLYLDNLGDLFAENASGGVDIPSVMKAYLEEGRVRVLAEARPELLDRIETRNPGFFSAFARLRIEPLSAAATSRVLAVTAAHDRASAPHRPTLSPAALATIVSLADRYLSYLSFPGKAMRLYDELRAMHERDRDDAGVPLVLERGHVTQAFSRQTGVPAFLLEEEAALSTPAVVEVLSRSVVGQDEAVQRVAEVVAVVKARLATGEKPLATLLFVGPTGVGKTELARALSSYLFGREERMVRFDMSEYMDSEAADRLLRGTARQEGALTRKVREQPFCVLLLDEIEKAHSGVFDLLLQVAGEGRLTDARGRTAYFHNAILILTSNLGAAGRRAPVGFDRSSPDDGTYYDKVVDKAFRPELVNRLDRIVAFRSLGPTQVATIARSALRKIAERRGFSEQSIRLVLDEVPNAAGDTPETYLARRGYSEALGARALRRTLEDELVSPAAALVAGLGADGHDLDVHVSLGEGLGESGADRADVIASRQVGALAFRAVRAQKRAKQGRAARVVADIAALRRTADGLLDLPRAEDLRDHLAYLTADLASARGKRKEGREQAALLAEHDRESRALRPVEEVLEKIRTLEEVAMTALFDGEPVEPFTADADALSAALMAKVPALLLARDTLTTHVTLVLDELDDGRALDHYLLPLYEEAKRRDWSIRTYLPKHVAPRESAQGPWVRVAQPHALLADPQRHFRSALIEIIGPLSVLLGLERGRHVFRGLAGERDAAELFVTFLKRGNLDADDFSDGDAEPIAPTALPHVRATPVVRLYDVERGTIKIGGAEPVEIPPAAYFERFDEIMAPTLLMYEKNPALDRWALFEGDLD